MTFELHQGYLPTAIGRVAELHARYYSALVGFGLPFEAKVARELAEFCERYDESRDGLWLLLQDGRVEGSIAIDGARAAAQDVFGHGAIEQEGILTDEGDAIIERGGGDGGGGLVGDANCVEGGDGVLDAHHHGVDGANVGQLEHGERLVTAVGEHDVHVLRDCRRRHGVFFHLAGVVHDVCGGTERAPSP
jgi:hypothetical protein